jgi:hypothetical protein
MLLYRGACLFAIPLQRAALNFLTLGRCLTVCATNWLHIFPLCVIIYATKELRISINGTEQKNGGVMTRRADDENAIPLSTFNVRRAAK